MGSVADLFVVLDSVTDPFSAGMKRAAADAEAQSKRMSGALGAVTKVGLGLAVAAGGIAVASAKSAADFQSTMETLHTQAGVAQDQIAGLSAGVLNLAGQVGFAPNSLAEALYHIESSFASVGITGPKALNLLQIAAEGAAVGHADLVDVTNALDAAIASGIPGVQDFQQAMGVLNSVVGSGDMTMQDLANAFSTGALANVKSYGASITDVGAALAVFGDNNIRGQNAATDLRMAMQALQTPAKSAADLLAKMGMDAHTLGDTMSKGGLLPTLELLHQKMDTLGYTEQTQGAALTELFGKKAGAGIVVLYDQLDRLKSKYPDQINGAKNFADAWVQTKATVSQQVKEIGAGVDALGVRIGMWLVPQISKLITVGESAGSQVVSGFTGAAMRPVAHDNLHNAMLNQEAAAPAPLTGWQQFGQKVHQYLTDIENDAKKLAPLGQDLVRFGTDVYQGGVKLLSGLEPTAKLLGGALLLGLTETGHVLADVVGPAFKWFGDFIDSHKTLFEVFAVTVLGTMATKMTIIGGINAARSVVELATSIASFPLSQAGQIGDALSALKTAYSGKDAAEGERAVKGLSGAVGDLKGSVSGLLDKIPALDGVRLKLMGVKDEAAGLEQAAGAAPKELGALESGIGDVGSAAAKAEGAAGGLVGSLGKLALPAMIVAGVGAIGYALGKLAGVGDHTGQNMQQLTEQLRLAGQGSSAASSAFTQTAAQMAFAQSAMSHFGKQAQGMQDVDSALAQLASSGHVAQARDQFNQIAAALAHQGIDARAAAGEFPQYEQALKDTGDAAKTADGQVQALTGALGQQQSLDQFASDLNAVTNALNANGASLSDNTDGAIANRQAFQQAAGDIENYYQQQRNAGVPINQATADLQQQVDQLEKTGIQAGLTKGDVDQYLKTLGLIPSSIGTTITADVGPAMSSVNGLIQRIDSMTGTIQVTGSGGGVYAGGRAYANADGGPVRKGQLSWVGERGPELVVFGQDGYVIPNEALSGSRSLDPRILSGSGGYGTAAYVPGFGQGGTSVVNNYNVNFAGSLMTEDQALAKLRTAQLQWSARNGGNGWSVPA